MYNKLHIHICHQEVLFFSLVEYNVQKSAPLNYSGAVFFINHIR